jgi:hypothetical protein
MRFKLIFALLLVAVFVSAGAVFAQEAPKAEEPKPLVEVSGVLFLDWYYIMTDELADTAKKGDGKEGADGMRLTRAYVTFAKKIDDVWSMKATLDGAGLATINEYSAKDEDTSGDLQEEEVTKSSKASNVVFFKNAYVQMQEKFDSADLKVQFGITSTPVIGITDQISGARWINQNAMDASKEILGGDSLDVSSADLGLKADLNIMKMVTLTGMYSNGDGYRYTEEQKVTDKSYWGVLSITPIKGVFLNGYYHKRDVVVADVDDDEVTYYGGGVAWSDNSFKVGANYFMGTRDADSSTPENQKDYTIMDIWALINLNEVIGTPILLYGRYGIGTTETDALKTSDDVTKVDSNTYYVGVGYQFNKSVQALVTYQSKTDDVKTGDGTKDSDLTDEIIWVKTETKF